MQFWQQQGRTDVQPVVNQALGSKVLLWKGKAKVKPALANAYSKVSVQVAIGDSGRTFMNNYSMAV